jgi:mRNA-degrading endonuclease toxin of MazEF toxin-antitoxin module
MADKVTTIQRSKVAKRIGKVPEDVMRGIDRAVLVFLGLDGI